MRVLAALLVVFLLSTAWATQRVAGREIHVDNLSGSDSCTGEHVRNMPDRSGPVRTIAKALWLAHGGDRIVLAKTGQPYRESISLVGSRHSGLLDQPFAIEGHGAMLDGSAPVPPDAWEHDRGAVFRFRPPRTGYQQLFLDDRPAVRVEASQPALSATPRARDRLAIPATDASPHGQPPKLKPLQWCLYSGDILFCVQPGKLPKDYNLSYARQQTGVTLFHVRRVLISNLTVQGFRIDGINAFNSAREIRITGVTCRGNGRAGITVGGASQVEIDSCVLGNNGRAQLLTLPFSETWVRSSQLFANTAPAWVDQGGRVYINGKRVEGGIDRDVPP